MPATWDRREAGEQRRLQDAALRRQLTDAVVAFSPFWRDRFAAAGLAAGDIGEVGALGKIAAVTERDVCPDGDPAGAARLVLQMGEAGYAVHAPGPELRSALARRLVRPAAYRQEVAARSRPLVYHLGGQTIPLPIASTRSDLELMARAGARAWAVLGLSDRDILLDAVPADGGLAALALGYAALGAGAARIPVTPATARLLGATAPTVLAVRDRDGAQGLLSAVGGRSAAASLRTVLVTGDVTGVGELFPGVPVLRIWGPPDGRVLYAQCPQPGSDGGLHTYPDLEILECVEPATGASATTGELVVTQLGFGGSALLRWRTGAVLGEPIRTGPCPGCGRTVPRLPATLAVGAVAPRVDVGARTGVALDVRAVAAALAGRADLRGWAVEVRRSARTGREQLIVRIDPVDADDASAVAAHREIRLAAGAGPTQVVLDRAGSVAGGVIRWAESSP